MPPPRRPARGRSLTTVQYDTHHHGRSLPGSAIYDPPKSYSEAFWRVDGTFGCGDMMYSGHVVSLTIDACVFVWYPNPLGIGGKVGFVLGVFAEALLIIGARKHYTADTIVGGYMGVLLFLAVCAVWPDEDDAPAVARGGGGDGGERARKLYVETESVAGEEDKRGLRHGEEPPRQASQTAPSRRAPSAVQRTALAEEIDGRIDGGEGKRKADSLACV